MTKKEKSIHVFRTNQVGQEENTDRSIVEVCPEFGLAIGNSSW